MAPTFEEMFACATTDSNDPDGPIVTKSRPCSPAASDHSVGLNDIEFQDLAHSLEVTIIPAGDKRVPISKPNPSPSTYLFRLWRVKVSALESQSERFDSILTLTSALTPY